MSSEWRDITAFGDFALQRVAMGPFGSSIKSCRPSSKKVFPFLARSASHGFHDTVKAEREPGFATSTSEHAERLAKSIVFGVRRCIYRHAGTASHSCAKPTPRSKPSRRRCSSRGSSISTPSAPSRKAAPRKAAGWTKRPLRCFRMRSRNRNWGWCRGGGGLGQLGRVSLACTKASINPLIQPDVCF
jgi:hypothetical protein